MRIIAARADRRDKFGTVEHLPAVGKGFPLDGGNSIPGCVALLVGASLVTSGVRLADTGWSLRPLQERHDCDPLGLHAGSALLPVFQVLDNNAAVHGGERRHGDDKEDEVEDAQEQQIAAIHAR